jgi:flavin-dependent dehydrogenase
MEEARKEAMTPEWDVLVIGGGPAGSATAIRLARKGRRVLLVEKAHHPRFHIGESLLPWSMPYLEELGMLEELNQGLGNLKRGVDFFSDTEHKTHQTYCFERRWAKDSAHAFEVERSLFDERLFRKAGEADVTTREGTRVVGIEFREDGASRVTLRDDKREDYPCTARFVVDASGRDTFLSKRFEIKRKNRKHANSALYGYYRDVPCQPGKNEGNLCLYWFDYGWIWLIPLKSGLMSVGAVGTPDYFKTRDCPPGEFLMQTLERSPLLAKRMRGAAIEGKVRATGNFSYFSRTAAGKGWLLVGDAFAFLDPVFSSGVHLALVSAFHAADAVDEILDHPERAKRLTRAYERRVRRGLKRFAWFVYRFNMPAFRFLFMDPSNHFGMFDAVRGMLGGDVFGSERKQAPIRLFQGIYYITSLVMWRDSLVAWRQRRRNVTATHQ